MSRPVRFLSVLLLAAASLHARTWTDTQGRTIEAEFVKTSGDTVTIRRADGRVFELSLDTLSAADKDYAVSQPAPAAAPANVGGPIPFTYLNTLLGLDLLADDNLWDDTPADVARRLHLPLEGKTAHFESYRAYPRKPVTVLGAQACMLSLQASDGRINAITLMFSNRGDYPSFRDRDPLSTPTKDELKAFDQALKTDFETLAASLAPLGKPKSEIPVGGLDPKRRSLRWTWGAESLVVSQDAEQMVSLKIVPSMRADYRLLSDEQVRVLLKTRVTRRGNGDVILDQIPMVDQGPKGYCVPATFERYLRYVGIPADMYELAAAGGTDFGGSSSFEAMASGLDRYVRRQGRRFEKAAIKLNLKGLARYLDEGRPVVWGLYSTEPFNALSSALTRARRETTDWTLWKKTAAAADTSALMPDSACGHACLIIGYNRATNEIAFTDSWGPAFTERWVPLGAAQKISQDEFWVISW